MDRVLQYARDGNLGNIAEASEDGSMVVGRTSLSMTQWANLVNDGRKPMRMTRLVRNGFSGNDLTRLSRAEKSFKRASKLRRMGVPADDVMYYATSASTKRGTRFRLALAEVLSGRLKRSPAETKDVIEKIKPGEYALAGGATYKDVNEWCQKNPKDAKDSFVCQQLPPVPTKERGNSRDS